MIASLLWTGFKMFYVHRSTSVTVSQLAMQMFSHDNEYHWGVRGGFGKRPYFLQLFSATFPYTVPKKVEETHECILKCILESSLQFHKMAD